MSSLFRRLLGSLCIVAASNAYAGVITQDGVVFTSTYSGNVLTLEIDAAQRSGGWAGATAIDALSLKTIGSFSGVTMSTGTGTRWALNTGELNAGGCTSGKGRAGADLTRLCYAGAGIALSDNMVFTFSFEGSPTLAAPHLKVHLVDARGAKTGSLLSLDFPAQPAAGSTGSQGGTGASQTGSNGAQAGTGGTQTGSTPADQGLIPSPPLAATGAGPQAPAVTLPATTLDDDSTDGEVPEPQTAFVIGAGLAAMGLARRRKRHLPG